MEGRRRRRFSRGAAVFGLAGITVFVGPSTAHAHFPDYCGHYDKPINSVEMWLYDGWRSGTGYYHQHKYIHWNGGSGIEHSGWKQCPYTH